MPYPNVPKALWPKMEKCVADVKAKGGNVNPYAVCFTSIVGHGVSRAAKDRLKKGREAK